MNLNFSKQILLFVFTSFINVNLLSAQYSDTTFLTTDTVQKIKSNRTKENIWISAGIPSLMIAYGIYSFESGKLKRIDNQTSYEIIEDNYLMKSNLDDYLQFSPAVAAFGLKLAGVESKHNLSDMAILYALSNILETGIVYTTKTATKRLRPDGSKDNSFPSGHTATAFVAAEFLHQEYKDQSVWISVGGYTMASLIGISRVLNNKHWVSDVVAGAGIGIISTKIVYWTYPYMQKMFSRKKTKHTQALVFPSYNNKVLGLNLSYRF
ncbi:MAG: phosphatase PAP2 family protein [Prevotellaceae bacterium]|jgi:membrane-associated phospholipid phosphatase|nr:phosphatase PAP2 family protein [Prevotellaceae bacterium]